MTSRQYRRWRVTAQSTWKKSVASIVAACARRNCRHVVSVCRFGAGGELQYLEDPADRRRADPVAELEQFALDPLVSPAAVLGGEPPGQRGDLCAGWRSSCAARIGPLPGDQAAVPPKDGSRGDQAVCSQLPWQVPDQRGHDGSAGPVEAGSGPGAAQQGRPRAAAPAVPRLWTLTSGRAGPASLS